MSERDSLSTIRASSASLVDEARARWSVLRVVAAYTVFALIWIGASDLLGDAVFGDEIAHKANYQVSKGIAFVAITSAMLYALIQSHSARLVRAERRERIAFNERMRALRLLESVAEASSDAIYAKDLQGRYLLCNREVALLFGRVSTEVFGKDDTEIFPEDQALLLRENDLKVQDENRILSFEENLTTTRGQRLFLSTKGPLVDADGGVIGVFGISRDITAIDEVKRSLRRANRALRLLSSYRHVVPQAHSEAELLGELCRQVTEQGGYRMAWIGLAEDSPGCPVRPVAQAGFDDGYLSAIQVSWADTEQGRGPCGVAIRERRPVAARNIHTDPAMLPWRAAALARGYSAAISLPIVEASHTCFGALSIYADETDAFDDDEVSLLVELTTDLAFGLRTLRERSGRKAAEDRLKLALETSGQGIYDVDLATGEAMISPEYATMLGYEPGAFRETMEGWVTRLHPDDREVVVSSFKKCASGELDEFRHEFRLRTRDGAHVWVLSVGRIVERDASGAPTRFLGTLTDINRRKQSEAAMRESEERYRSLFDNSSSVMLIVDPESGSIVAANHAAVVFYGWPKAKLLAMKISEINTLAPNSISSEMALARLQSARFEFRHRIADGSVRDVEVFSGPIPVDGRDLLYSVVHDITERKRDEEKIAFLALRADRLLELPVASEQCDESTFLQRGEQIIEQLTASEISFIHFVSDDQQSVELVAWSRKIRSRGQDSANHHHFAVNAAGSWADALRLRQPVIVSGVGADAEKQGLPPSPSDLHRLLVVPVFDSGNVVMLAGVGNKSGEYTQLDIETVQVFANDIWRFVQRRRADERLRKLSLAVEQSLESIVITNLAGDIEYVNEAFLMNTGYTRDEVIGRNPRVLQSGQTPPESYTELWEVLSRGESWKGRFYNKRKDGSVYVEMATISPIRQSNGEISHYVAVKEDITEKTRLGVELDQYRHHLESLVSTRTAELAEARERAEEASRSKSAFLANMSHEIRTPLNAIVGLSHLMRRDGVSPEQAKRLDGIHAAGLHLLAVISDILDLSKIEAGKLELERTPCHLSSILDNVVALISMQSTAKGLALVVENDERIGWFLGDPTRIRQALLNYTSNAIKFTERGGITIRTRLIEEQADQLLLRFEVQDTGIGIDADAVTRLFKAFGQADSSTTRKYGGTGLGLTITSKIASLMGGESGVESEPGVGSTFWFTLRVERTQAKDEPISVAGVGDVEERLRRDFAGARVLLVEDNPVNQEVALELLHCVGLSVDLAQNGREAVLRARGGVYDIVLMDMQMPVMDGLEATQEIRQIEGWRDVPILAMTANAFSEDRASCEAAGMNDFLSKPVEPAVLYETLCRWLHPAPAAVPSERKPTRQTGEIGLYGPERWDETEIRPIDPALASLDSPLVRGLERHSSNPAGRSGSMAVRTSTRPASYFAADLGGLTALKNLETHRAISRVSGNVEKYVALLRQFTETQRAALSTLAESLASGDLEQARALAHSMKGAAAVLGATRIVELASVIEVAARQGKAEPSGLGEIERELAAIEAALPRRISIRPDTSPPDPGEVAAVLYELEELLVQSDAAAEALAGRHQAELRFALGGSHADFVRAINSFDFDRALSILRARTAAEG